MTKVRPKKQLGQHFLVDERYARRVAGIADQFTSSNILEIGPGMGVLTRFLQSETKRLKLIEIDKESVEYLHTYYPGLEIIEADFLRYDLNKLGWDEWSVIGNYPYNISSQIVFRALEYRDRITDIGGMFQLEVAQRLAAQPGSKIYGILSVLLQAFYDVNLEFKVPPGAFNPPPKVMSAVIHARRKDRFTLDCDEGLFFRVVKTAFNHRRKTIANNMVKFNIPRELVLKNQFAKLRAENLDVESYIELTNFISGHIR